MGLWRLRPNGPPKLAARTLKNVLGVKQLKALCKMQAVTALVYTLANNIVFKMVYIYICQMFSGPSGK
jgi:hypothetical protein